jgi:hypothetical protein
MIAGSKSTGQITQVIGEIPYRIALAGGWIDQPFVSKLNPDPPGSMVVIGLHPTFCWMERAGMATGTRNVALKLWHGKMPAGNSAKLVEELYAEENKGKTEPSGSQDMIGLLYPGVNRLDYDFNHKGGIFPKHIESCNDQKIARWLEKVIKVLAVAPRPDGYNPLGVRNLDAEWVRRLGQSGKDCYSAIMAMDVKALGASMNECMKCWKTILPHTVVHPTIKTDLLGVMHYYQSKYPGAMYSGCGGGYLYVVSDEPVPGAFKVNVRTK